MKPPESRKAELGSNATGGEKPHAEAAEFKMTELGPIPVDWEVKRIIDVAPLQRGFDLPFSHLMEGVVPVVYSNGIGAYHSKGKCKGPGLVTGRSGTIGKFFYIESGDYWPHNTTLWVTDFCGNNPLFVKYLYETLDFEDFSTGTGVPTLNRNSVHEHKVVIPPLAEQQAIATALSDIDELILALGKLIEKKRNIKTGAMQQLLTGKTRLPGFGANSLRSNHSHAEAQRGRGIEFKQTELGPIPVDWEVKRLGDVAKIGNGKDYKHLPEGNVPVYGTGGLMTYVNACLYDGATVCIGRKGTIDEPQYHEGKIWTVDTLFYTYDFKGVDPKFLYYLFTRINWHSYNSATGVPSLTAVTILGIDISLPPLAEQQAIAAVLSDMDAEIAALEAKRAKYESIKQGMMQELLTGKTRLKGA